MFSHAAGYLSLLIYSHTLDFQRNQRLCSNGGSECDLRETGGEKNERDETKSTELKRTESPCDVPLLKSNLMVVPFFFCHFFSTVRAQRVKLKPEVEVLNVQHVVRCMNEEERYERNTFDLIFV